MSNPWGNNDVPIFHFRHIDDDGKVRYFLELHQYLGYVINPYKPTGIEGWSAKQLAKEGVRNETDEYLLLEDESEYGVQLHEVTCRWPDITEDVIDVKLTSEVQHKDYTTYRLQHDLIPVIQLLYGVRKKIYWPAEKKSVVGWLKDYLKNWSMGELEKQKQTQPVDLAKAALVRFSGELVGVAEAAEILGVSAHRARTFAREGRIGTEIAGRYVFSRTELAEFQKIERPHGVRHTFPEST